MIQGLKATLLEIRKERDDELALYKSYLSGDSARLEERKAVLTLELPFKTDSASVLHARASAYQVLDNARDDLLGIIDEQEITRQEDGLMVRKRLKNHSKTAHSLIGEWIRSADPATAHSRRTVYYILKKWIALTVAPDQLSAENLPHILTMEGMSKIINGLDVDLSTKEVYLSHARNLRDFVMKAYPISPVLNGRRSRLSLDDAAKLFEFLETRALKSTTIRAYHDLLLCRALFYAPLPEKRLFELGAPDEKFSCLRSGDDAFSVPRSFVRLWKEFSCPDSLFSRAFDDRQLHKKIQRLGKYAELTIESLTPSILRGSAKAIYRTHLLLSDDVVPLLPKRS